MNKLLFSAIVLSLQLFCFAAISHSKTVVFYIGGWRMTNEQMESFSRIVPETNKVKFMLPEALNDLVRPWYCADLVYNYIHTSSLIVDDLIVVAFSHGGTVAQWLLSAHPELPVKKLILVGSPIGGYKFLPPNNFFSNDFPENLPIYVIAGNKGQDAWFLRKENDGVVDLDSALDIRDQNLKDFAVFNADHAELKNLSEVQNQISRWLELENDPSMNYLAENMKASFADNHFNSSPYKASN